MTKSKLIAKLAREYPQLVAKDAEDACGVALLFRDFKEKE
jgi:hypothetical protein